MNPKENHDSRQSSEDSSNRLLKILIAVGIGIPVLIELMTVFNLINVQIFGNGDKEVAKQEQPVVEEQLFAEGDTLFADFGSPLLIEEMRAKVDAQQWRFAIQFNRIDSSETEQPIKIDSLRLQSGKVLDIQKAYQWDRTDGKIYISDEWTLPSGDIPVTMYISSDQSMSSDTTERVQQEVKLDNLPVRYNVDE